MRDYPFHFFFGFLLSFIPLLLFVKNNANSVKPAPVLAYEQKQEVEHVVLAEETTAPQVASASFETATPTSSPTPEPSPTNTPTPMPTSTAAPTPTPSPTATPDPTPTPVPTATPDVWAPPEYEDWIVKYAALYAIDRNLLDRIGNCESHFNPQAVNGPYVGMYQFNKTTWITYRQELGLDANPDLRTNPEESIKTAAYLISKRGTEPWPLCLN